MDSIIDQIREKLTDSFEIELFDASIYNLRDVNNKLRINNLAYSFRELIKSHVLPRLAPSKNLQNCSCYTKKSNRLLQQQVQYALIGGLDKIYVKNNIEFIEEDLDSVVKEMKDVYDKLCEFTHVKLPTFNLAKCEQDRLILDILNTIYYFLSRIDWYREYIKDYIGESIIQDELLERVMNEAIPEFYEISSRHYIDSVDVEEHKVMQITDEFIEISVEGSISVTLSYGSSDDEANLDETFPFTALMRTSIDLTNIQPEVISDSFIVDTKSWFT
jgi:Predicted pPIWI-associating nuclease